MALQIEPKKIFDNKVVIFVLNRQFLNNSQNVDNQELINDILNDLNKFLFI